MEEPIIFDWRGSAMLGIYHKVLDTHAPGVLYIPGMLGDRVDIRRIQVRMARRLQQQGIAGLRVDLYASGVSDGVFHRLTYTMELAQVLFLIDAIRSYDLWKGPIILLGLSQGAKLAIAAARQRRDVAGICLWSGIITAEPGIAAIPALRPYKVDGQIVLNMDWGVWINRALFSDAQDFTVFRVDMLPNIPMFGVFGSNDTSTKMSSSLLQQAGHPVLFVPDSGHAFTTFAWELELMNGTENWLKKQFILPSVMKEGLI